MSALSDPELAAATCARRLAPLGLRPARGLTGAGHHHRFVLADGGDVEGPSVDLDLSWFGPAAAADRPGSEAVIQALSGLMALHGRDAGGPRRIGLEVASVGAGILAAHAVAAAAIGRHRDRDVGRIETSVLGAGLLLGSHRIAAATSGEEWVPAPAADGPGPPFRSADGHGFEIETMDPTVWRTFWTFLGAGPADAERAWRLFRPRYFRGTCTLPPGLHAAAAGHRIGRIEEVASQCEVSLARIRDYEDVLDHPGRSAGHPDVQPLAGGGRHPVRDPGPDGGLPLEGVRVVEATSRMQGPLAGLLLRMLGAHVTHVEPPVGDFTRTVPPLVDGTGTFFLCFNRGKEAVELDLARSGGREELRALVADADVFLHNWRPGKAAEWSLGAEDLATVNPGLVYVHASGWGDDPSLSPLLGTDFLVQAYSGMGAGITPIGERPAPSRALLTDHLGALVTAEAILSGLLHRERSGRGQRVGASLLSAAMALQAHVLDALVEGQEKGRQGGRPLWGPLDHPLPTADGTVAVSVEDDADLHRLAEICGVEADATTEGSIEPILARRIASGRTAHWEERLREAGIPCVPVRTDLTTVAEDPDLAPLLEPIGGSAVTFAAPWRFHP